MSDTTHVWFRLSARTSTLHLHKRGTELGCECGSARMVRDAANGHDRETVAAQQNKERWKTSQKSVWNYDIMLDRMRVYISCCLIKKNNVIIIVDRQHTGFMKIWRRSQMCAKEKRTQQPNGVERKGHLASSSKTLLFAPSEQQE